jgi:hypothetical protein
MRKLSVVVVLLVVQLIVFAQSAELEVGDVLALSKQALFYSLKS